MKTFTKTMKIVLLSIAFIVCMNVWTPSVHASDLKPNYSICSQVRYLQIGTNSSSNSSYTVTATLYGTFDAVNNEFCGGMFADASITQHSYTVGGTLTDELLYNGTSTTNDANTSDTGQIATTVGIGTYIEYTSCGFAIATFYPKTGGSLTASIGTVCE